MDNIVQEFTNRFSGFDDPKYLEEERDYKINNHHFALEILNKEQYRQLLGEVQYDEILKRLLKICQYIKQGALMHFEDYQILRSGYKPKECAVTIFNLLFSENELLEARIDELASYIREYGHSAKTQEFKPYMMPTEGKMWNFISFLLATYYPDKYIFVKPTKFDEFIKLAKLTNPRTSEMTGKSYQKVLELVNEVKYKLEANGIFPQDMVDIQSFIFILGGGYEDIEAYGEAKFWMFNVYYASEPKVWEECKKLHVAAMQYAEGSQSPSSVTLNVNRAKLIHEGDFIIAYSGEKGFLGFGTVTKAFYEEADENLFIKVNGGEWRQRVGVDWIKTVDKPIQLNENGFKDNLGVKDVVMSSYTIFEITQTGFEKVRNLLEGNKSAANYIEKASLDNSFTHFVRGKGFNFDEKTLQNYVVSLKSKPFVILSGISGTGKTKIAQFFAEYMCPDEPCCDSKLPEEDTIIFDIKRYTIENRGWVIPQKKAQLFPLPENNSSHLIDVSFDGVIGKCRLLNEKNGSQRSITFSGEVGKHLVANYKIGDYIKVSVEETQGGIITKFDRYSPSKTMKKSKRYLFLSVRPDWTDNKSLLGYYNPITEEYQATELLKLMLRAKDDLTRPYFVVLDEMNLAKVEYYFSDFLSCLESRRTGPDGAIKSEPVILHDCDTIPYIDDAGETYYIPSCMEIPDNIYFTGTVNVDETTYMFSPKVLDRANVIEFNDVDITGYFNYIKEFAKSKQDIFASKQYVNEFNDEGNYHKTLIDKSFYKDCDLSICGQYLKDIYAILARENLHFGYRVIDEILYYVKNAREIGCFDTITAIDYQIVQRILPKMHGNRKRLEAVLSNLLLYCFSIKNDVSIIRQLGRADWMYLDNYYSGSGLAVTEESVLKDKKVVFPLTAKKVYRMLLKLKDAGFVSFIE